MTEMLQKAKDWLTGRQRAYRTVFDSPAGREVLADIEKFCRANESTFHPDPRVAAQLDGRREVWLRIQQHMQMDSSALWALYNERMKQ